MALGILVALQGLLILEAPFHLLAQENQENPDYLEVPVVLSHQEAQIFQFLYN